MSIAFGVKCSDGVVLGVDLEYTQDLSSMPGQKMFWLPKTNANYFVLIAATGNPDSSKAFMEMLEEELQERIPDGNPTWKQLKRAIQACLRQVYIEHIDIAPENERHALACDLLVALRIHEETRLYHSNRTMLIEEKGAYCCGVGLYAARSMSDVFLGYWPRLSTAAAAQVVSYIVSNAKNHIQSVGHGSDIHILPADGLPYTLLWREREQVDADFDSLLQDFRNCISQIGKSEDDHVYPECVSWFKKSLDTLRESQSKRARDRINRDLTLAQPSGGSSES